jgi:tetratricopeptide (TPR) repeat protein
MLRPLAPACSLVAILLLTATSASPQSDRLVRQATALDNQKRFTQAVPLLRRAVKLAPRNSEAHLRLGHALAGVKHYPEAIKEYRTGMRSGSDANWHFQLGYSLQQTNAHSEAVAEFRRAVALNPKDGDAFYDLGYSYDAVDRHDDSLAAYRQAARLNPKDYEALGQVGKELVDLSRHREALPVLTQAIGLHPRYAIGLSNRAIARDHLGDLKGALKDVDQAIKLGPALPTFHHTRASVLAHMGRLEDAVGAYTAALKLPNAPAFTYEDRAFALLGLGRGAEAAADAETYIRVQGLKDPKLPYVAFGGYLGYRQAGKDTEARRLIALVPASEGWTDQLRRFVQGELSSGDLIRAAKDNDQLTEAHAYSGFMLALDGKREAALEHLEWVTAHGVPTFLETVAARGWAARLKR